LNCHLLLPNK